MKRDMINVFDSNKTTFYDLLTEEETKGELPVVLAKVDNRYLELGSFIEDGDIEFIKIDDNLGMAAYARTLQFVFIKATLDLFKDARINIEHSLSKGVFAEVHKEEVLSEEDVKRIKCKMDEIINKNIRIEKFQVSKVEAIEIFENYKMQDKIKLLHYVNSDKVNLYKLENRYDYFYGKMAYSTGVLKYFDIMYYEPGVILRFPEYTNPAIIPKFIEQKKLANVFCETEKWLNILDVPDVGSLNQKLEGDELGNVIRVSEALHEKKIAYIADMISKKAETKIVLISGPSSSGKTTFANRLSIQLRVNGLVPIPISLDDYFVDRTYTPLDEEGKPDFESINALDLKLFNDNLHDILNGKSVEIPNYNFKTGKREWLGRNLKLPDNGILVVEGIHGLNNELTKSIKDNSKFKIYISALTQLNLDNHNRIATTDVRKIRRIVRDFLSRGYGGEDTLKMWPSIKRGEEKNIFIYQEQADVMFNSTLVYELSVLKKFAIEELSKIGPESEVYYEASRLISFLNFFVEIERDKVPENSILREFIGGSCFYKY